MKTFSALGVYGLTAITCVVAETPGKVARIQSLEADIVRKQVEVLFATFPIAAIKTGLLHSADIVTASAQILGKRAKKIPLVIDPVMIATSGASLLRPEAIARYERELFPLATLITPNLNEAAKLLGEAITDVNSMREAGKTLVKRYRVPFLLKGGHLNGKRAVDLLFLDGKIIEFSTPFTRGVATHGTGCTYSAAIAAGLAHLHRRSGLRLLFAPAGSLPERHPFPHYSHDKRLFVFGTALRNQFINRAARRNCLQQFLQMAFRVNVDRILGELRKFRAHRGEDDVAHSREIAVQIDRANESFEGIGQR